MKKRKWFLRLGILCLLASPLALTGCGDDGDDITIIEGGDAETAGIDAQWARSGHADAESPAFTNWDAEGEIPIRCARCHSPEGFVSYALDGTIEEAVATGGVIGCNACHSSTLYADFFDFDEGMPPTLEPVEFPSGLTATLNGPSNICMVCHQGRASKVQVDEAIAAGTPGNLSFINIHYYPAAATLFGTQVMGGYEYEGRAYVGRFAHVPSHDTCVECHMGRNANHTFEPQAEDCARCHEEVDADADPEAEDTFRSIRRGTTADYDGDGNTEEGLYFEINDTLAPALLTTIQNYAQNTLGLRIAYNPAQHPYFFVDDNANNQIDPGETTRFNQFDAPLLRAAYNYQVVQKEPCGYIHNARYLVQLLYDSIQELGGDVSRYVRPTAVNEVGAQGIVAEWEASGHGDVTAPAFNDWNDTGEIPATCAKCHSEEGFRDFAEDGTVEEAVAVELEEGTDHVNREGTLVCGTCHVNEGVIAVTVDPTTLYAAGDFPALEPVTFPSGLTATLNGPSNMCMACHQGRASKVQVDNAIAANPTGTFPFINIHYYAAAASVFGSVVKGGYEYDGMTYRGQNTFPAHQSLVPTFTTCVGCHMGGEEEADHTFVPEVSDCTSAAGCHSGDAFESLSGSPAQNLQAIETLSETLFTEIEEYAATTLNQPILYSETTYPYFFQDLNANGVLDETEAVRTNGYPFDATLLRAAYNFQVAQKEPCGYIHNGTYIQQLLFDSIVDLGGTPTVTPPNRGGTQPPPVEGAPTANAGPDQADVALGSQVTLNATGSSDPQNQPLTFSWALQAPQGSAATLTGANTATPTFTPDVAGTYTATVTVSDGTNTATDTVTVTTVGEQPPPAIDGAALYAGAGCAGCHGANGEGLGTFPNIQGITLAELRAAPSFIGAHAAIAGWTDPQAQAVVDFLAP